MRLRVETMDAVLVEYGADGRVRFEDEGWSTPTRHERRAIIHAAESAMAELTDLIQALDESSSPPDTPPRGRA